MIHSTDDHDLKMGCLLVDRAGVIRHAHTGVAALLGFDTSQCEGRPLDEVLPSPNLVEALRRVIAGAASYAAITVRLDAPIRRLLLSLAPVRGATVEPMVMILIASADDREASAALRLRTTIESVTAGFAHEVRNPIAAILSITEAALSNLAPESLATSMLIRIPALVNRVDKLIKESLRFSRPRFPKRSPQRLRQLVDWSVELAQMEKSSVDLDVKMDEALGLVLVDPEHIEQVLVNLLCNARDAARSRVWLSARRAPQLLASGARRSRVLLEVSDDGAGVPNELRERIFDPFFTTKAHGTGLGLAIARELARLNGADLALYSTSERGTTFTLHLEELPPVALLEPRVGQA